MSINTSLSKVEIKSIIHGVILIFFVFVASLARLQFARNARAWCKSTASQRAAATAASSPPSFKASATDVTTLIASTGRPKRVSSASRSVPSTRVTRRWTGNCCVGSAHSPTRGPWSGPSSRIRHGTPGSYNFLKLVRRQVSISCNFCGVFLCLLCFWEICFLST